VQLEGLGQLKISITSSGIEPAIFRLVTVFKQTLSLRHHQIASSVGRLDMQWEHESNPHFHFLSLLEAFTV
jgi:hypothetical protein